MSEEATIKPAQSVWGDDLLSRKRDAQAIETFLVRRIAEREAQGRVASYVLNLDAGWGQGKTFFLTRLNRQLLLAGYPVAHINAWEDDFADDPLVPVITGVAKAFPKLKGAGKRNLNAAVRVGANLAATLGKHAFKASVERALGKDGAELANNLGEALAKGTADAAIDLSGQLTDALGKAVIARFEETKTTITKFRSALADVVKSNEVQKPLFVLVDELDRCRPSYAISMLERIKHLFEIDGVVFVVATDTRQMQHAVSAVYGVQFDGQGYLTRFFDRTYRFAEPDRKTYVRHSLDMSGIDKDRLKSPPDDEHAQFLTGIFDAYGMTLRQIDRFMDNLHTATTLWGSKVPLQLVLLGPLIIAYIQSDLDEFDRLATLADLSKRPAELAGKFKVRFPSWRPSSESRFEDVPLSDLFNRFVRLAHRPLQEIGRETPSSAAGEWVRDQFRSEFSLLHRNQHDYHGPKSVVHEYADLVRTVSKLSTTESKPQQ